MRAHKYPYKLASNNTSGVTGVCWNRSKGKWQARGYFIKNLDLGSYPTKQQAIEAREFFDRVERDFLRYKREGGEGWNG